MTKVLYIACSPATGSTLLPFLLITHPEMCSVSHTTGWPYGEGETFQCSCGQVLEDCPFFRTIRDAFRDNDLPFDFRNFGTNYVLAENKHLNKLLTGSLSYIQNTKLESIRDSLVWRVPGFRATLAQQDRANLIFMKTALSYHGASVFADGSQDPNRLRHLRRIKELDIKVVHLIRDVRGIAISRRERNNWEPAVASRVWIRDQIAILRVLEGFPGYKRVYYEDVCDSPDETLATIHRFLGLTPHPYSGRFMEGEHHIIGNAMRLREGKITKSMRWKEEFSKKEIDSIIETMESFVDQYKQHPVSEIIRHYLASD